MPAGRPLKNLEPYKEALIGLFQAGATYETLSEWLLVEEGFKVSVRSLHRAFKQWDVSRRLRTSVTDQVKAKIQYCFFINNADDDEILEDLAKEGWYIGKWTLVRLRYELGLKRRIRGAEAQAEADRLTQEAIREELLTGPIDGYGKGMLYAHFRSTYHAIQRDRLFRNYRILNPEAVERRRRDIQRRKGEYIVPGPNWLWSVDGHDKLKPYGIEIYASVDAYSRYITWIYVGVSNSTAVSVVHQFLETVKSTGVFPQFVRSDCGGETGMLAYSQYRLSKSHDPTVKLSDCYLYGTSTANERIEKWWADQTKSWEFRWRSYLFHLTQRGEYNRQAIPDVVAMLSIYLPIVRAELFSFVQTWNLHYIRKQRGRPNVVNGRPHRLYTRPPGDTKDYGIPYNPDTLGDIESRIGVYDTGEYLPKETLTWCNVQFQEMGFDPYKARLKNQEDRDSPFYAEYLELRTRAQKHCDSGLLPVLSELPSPVGGFDWQIPPPEVGTVQHATAETDYDPDLESLHEER